MPDDVTNIPVVVKILDGGTKLVISKGSYRGWRVGQRVVIFGEGEEIVHPRTGESLGRLEILRGHGRVIHIQDKLITVESDEHRRSGGVKKIIRSSVGFSALGLGDRVEEIDNSTDEIVPFIGVSIDDGARPI